MGWEDALGLPRSDERHDRAADPGHTETVVDDATTTPDPTPDAEASPAAEPVLSVDTPAWGEALGSTDGLLPDDDVLSRASAGLGVQRRRRKRRNKSDKRLDIQGLRAVAVVAVVVNHLFDHPQGGFLGVDVFFVISGFLITSLLLREGNSSGSISLIGFYKRRVRRLFPAALTVIVLTVVASHLAFLSERAKSIQTDGIWAALFGANWREIHLNTDYFAAQGPVSPLQHYWSLSVEEQFYLVWPLVLLIAFAICRRRFAGRARATVVAGTVAALLLTLPSLVYAAANTGFLHATVSYFSTFSRAWELGLGATLAVLSGYMRGSRAVLSALSIIGLTVVAISLFAVGQSAVPFPGAIAPCLGTGLCLIAWTPAAAAWNPLLNNRVANYLGDISYSVYLVHFPVIIIGGALVTDRSVAFYVGVLLLILGLSALLYHGLENPLRQSNWLLPRGTPRRQIESRFGLAGLIGGATAVTAAAAVYALIIGVPSSNNPYAAQVLAQLDASATAGPAPTTGPQTVADLQTDLRRALLTNSWPTLHPALGSQTTIGGPGCATSPLPASQCTWGDKTAPHTIYLVGDSTSVALLNSFIGILKTLPDWKIRLAAGDGCPFTNVPVAKTDGNANSSTCPTRNQQVVDEINGTKPDLVVITSGQGSAEITGPETAQVKKIVGGAGAIAVLPAPPHMKNPQQCATALSKPADCVTTMPSEYAGWLTNERAVATAVGGTFIDPSDWYCADNLCPPFATDVPMMRDSVHQTTDYAGLIAPVVLEAFRKAGLLPAT